MTIASETSSAGPYAGDDTTDNFSFAFKVFDEADIAVVLTDSAGTDTTLTITTHYTVSLNADQEASPGGSVTLLTPPATGENLTILRDMTLTQGAALPNQGGWYPEVVEDALDKLTMIVQQHAEDLSRAVMVGVTGNPDTYLEDTQAAATAAAASQAAAAASAAAALISEGAAAASAGTAAASEAVVVALQADIQTCATNIAAIIAAPTEASNAAASALAAANTYDAFDDRYLGSKAADPAFDNDGNALLTGALYWNAASSQLRCYDGAAWQAITLQVAGPASSTDNAIVRFDGTTGKLVQDSAVTIDDTTGSLTFTGTSVRIKGDFSNATVANRLMFQTSTVNGSSAFGVIPNGTATTTNILLHNAEDPTNASLAAIGATSTDIRVQSSRNGSGTYLPMTFYTGGSERVRIDTNGNVGVGVTPSAWGSSGLFGVDISTLGGVCGTTSGTYISANAYINSSSQWTAKTTSQGSAYLCQYNGWAWYDMPSVSAGAQYTPALIASLSAATGFSIRQALTLGYGTGAGGTATQGSGSGKATAVTLSKPCGTITMNNATLNAGTTVSFTWTNTVIAAADTVVWSQQGGTNGAYTLTFTPGAGTCNVALRNVTAGNLGEAFAFNFTIIKGATS